MKNMVRLYFDERQEAGNERNVIVVVMHDVTQLSYHLLFFHVLRLLCKEYNLTSQYIMWHVEVVVLSMPYMDSPLNIIRCNHWSAPIAHAK